MAGIGRVIGPIAAGWTFDKMGSYHLVWLCFTGTTVVAVVLLLGLKAPCRMSEG
jgi:cyanate permease